jgi:hypothetical protein
MKKHLVFFSAAILLCVCAACDNPGQNKAADNTETVGDDHRDSSDRDMHRE